MDITTPLTIGQAFNSSLVPVAVLDVALAPPYGNTEAQNTEEEQGTCADGPRAGVLIDWLSFTFPADCPVSAALGWFGGPSDGWQQMDKGRYGYRKSFQRDGITILYDGSQTMGPHVEMSGQGCRAAESHGWVYNWPVFLAGLVASNLKIARLDVAIDECTGLLDLALIERESKTRRCVSRFKKVRALHSWELGVEGCPHESTLYFGSPTSNSMIRIYDKGAQMGTHDPYSTEIEREAEKLLFGRVTGHWMRCELQFRNNNAQLVAQVIGSNNWLEAANRLLYALLDFKVENSEDSNRSRWLTAPWWAAFVDCASKWPIGIKPAERTLLKVYSWVLKQVAPSLAILNTCASDGKALMQSIIRAGYKRFGPRHVQLALSETVQTTIEGSSCRDLWGPAQNWRFYEDCLPKDIDGFPLASVA